LVIADFTQARPEIRHFHAMLGLIEAAPMRSTKPTIFWRDLKSRIVSPT
jgi:hypothetical protein